MVRCVKVLAFLLILFAGCEAKKSKRVPIVLVPDVLNIVKIANLIYDMIEEYKTNKYVREQMQWLSIKSDMLAADMTATMSEVKYEIIENVPGLVELNRRLSQIHLDALSIDKSFDNFMLYIEEPKKYDAEIVKDFAFKAVSDDKNGLDQLLQEIYGLMVKNDMISLSTIDLLNKHMEIFLRYTNIPKSPQQLFSDLFDYIIYTELKGRLTIFYSYQILAENQTGKYKGHIEKSNNNFIARINKTVSAFKTVMAMASREIWKNDPSVHKEDVTYTELKHVFQEYIINEYDINTEDKCNGECPDYKVPTGKSKNRCYYDKEICSYQRACNGYLYDCRKQFGSAVKICPSQNVTRSLSNVNRRYLFIDSYDERYGPKGVNCSTNMIETDHHYSPPFASCDSCMCTCDDIDDEYSERFFNLEPSMTRIKDNYVVTGVRFIKDNRTIHIQIQEGRLLPDGYVDKNTVVWVPINKKPKKIYKLSWKESREINLDDLHAPEMDILVGLSFDSKENDAGHKRLHLKLFSLPINFINGTLFSNEDSTEITCESSRNEISLSNLDIPTRSVAAKNSLKSDNNQYLTFEPSSLEYDAGQSTIPFIDIQEIITSPPMPMSGAGIYQKRRKGSSGFIALKLFTYNLEPYLGINLLRSVNYKPKNISNSIKPILEETMKYLSSEPTDNDYSFSETAIIVITVIILLALTFFIVYKSITKFSHKIPYFNVY